MSPDRQMLNAFAILLIFQCLGEGVVWLLGLPLPGPVAGTLMLLAVLLARPGLRATLEEGANALLGHLSLLFVPAGVGIVAAASQGNGHWLALGAGVVASTLATQAVTALVLQALERRRPRPPEPPDA